MSEPLALSLIKGQLRLERDDEDDYLTLLSGAAVAHFENWTGCTLLAVDVSPTNIDIDAIKIRPDIQHGLLMLIAHWYENREAVGVKMTEAPMGTYALWGPYRIFNV